MQFLLLKKKIFSQEIIGNNSAKSTEKIHSETKRKRSKVLSNEKTLFSLNIFEDFLL